MPVDEPAAAAATDAQDDSVCSQRVKTKSRCKVSALTDRSTDLCLISTQVRWCQWHAAG